MNTQYLYDGLQTDKRKVAIDATVKLLRKHRKHFQHDDVTRVPVWGIGPKEFRP